MAINRNKPHQVRAMAWLIGKKNWPPMLAATSRPSCDKNFRRSTISFTFALLVPAAEVPKAEMGKNGGVSKDFYRLFLLRMLICLPSGNQTSQWKISYIKMGI
jgi:hypothetical protein